MSLLPQVTKQELKDIRILIEYCSDQNELKDFTNCIQENGSKALTDEDLEDLEEEDEELLEKAANDPKETHVWAVAHRLKGLLKRARPDQTPMYDR